MEAELRERLEKLAGAECPRCAGDGSVYGGFDDQGNEQPNFTDCPDCYGTGCKWWPLSSVNLNKQPCYCPDLCLACDAYQEIGQYELLYAVEQCLEMLGSWEYTYFCDGKYPHTYELLTRGAVDGTDRLAVAVDCLEAAIEEESNGRTT